MVSSEICIGDNFDFRLIKKCKNATNITLGRNFEENLGVQVRLRPQPSEMTTLANCCKCIITKKAENGSEISRLL